MKNCKKCMLVTLILSPAALSLLVCVTDGTAIVTLQTKNNDLNMRILYL